MKPSKTHTPLPLVNSEEELAALQKRLPKHGPRGGMVVWVEGLECVKIPLTRNHFALIDRSDYDSVGKFRWHSLKSGLRFYATRSLSKPRGAIRMHILILNHPSLEIDHKNLNGLDNRRLNLRPATPSQNQRNSTTSRGNKSGYKGVSFYKREAKWGAMSKNNGKAKWLGYFDSAIEAAKAYNDFVKKIEPEFARLNRV